MAGGVDITAAGGTPQPNNGLKPLISVIDKYQKQLNTVSKAIEDAAEASGATGGGPKAPEVLGPKTQEAINRLDRVIDKVAAAMDVRDRAREKESKVISAEAANPTFDGLARAIAATGEADKAANAYADSLKELGKAQQEFKDAQEADKQKPLAPQPAVDMRPNKELDDFFNTPLSDLKGPPPVQNADPRYNPDLDAALGIVTPPQPAPTGPTYLRPMPTGPVPYPFPQGAVQPPAPLPAATPVVPPPPATPVMPALTAGASGPVPVSIVNPLPVPVEGMTAPAPAPAAPVEPPAPKEDGPSLLNTLGGFKKALGPTALYLRALEEVAKAVSIALQPLDDAFEALGKALEPIAKTVGTILKATSAPIITVLKLLGKAISVLLSPFKILSTILDAFSGVVDEIGEAMDALSVPLEIFAEGLAMVIETMGAAFFAFAKASKSAKAPQTAVNDAFKNVKATVADLLINPLAAIPDLMGRIREAVDTFNPGGMIEFDLAMRDLMAVFGEALLPVVKTVTGVIRKFADTLRPILQTLAPAFQKLIDSIGNMLLGNIDKFSALLERMIPAFEAYLNQVIAAVDRQNAIDQQSKANESTLDDATSWIANWFRTTEQIATNAQKTKEGKDVIKQDVNRVVADPMTNAIMAINGMAIPIKDLQDEVNKQITDIAKERIKSRKEGTNTGEKEEQRRANEAMLESAVEMSKMRTKFLESNKPGKDKADALGKGGGVEMSLDEAIKDLGKARIERAQGKITPEQMAQSMNRVTEAQKFATEKMEEFLNKPVDLKGAAQGLAAAQNPAFKSIADLSRDTILKAFTATSSEAQMKEQQNKKAVDNVANLPNIIAQGVQAGMAIAMKDAQQQAPAAPQAPAFPIPQVA